MNLKLDTLKKAFKDFERKIDLLESMGSELKHLDTYGFGKEVREIKTRLKNISQIPFIESKLKELREKIDNRKNNQEGEEKAGKREKREKRKGRFSAWLNKRKSDIANLKFERQKQKEERQKQQEAERQKQKETERQKQEQAKRELEKQKQEESKTKEKETEKQKQQEAEKLTKYQIDKIEKSVEGLSSSKGETNLEGLPEANLEEKRKLFDKPSKKAPLVEDVLNELNEEIKSEQKEKPSKKPLLKINRMKVLSPISQEKPEIKEEPKEISLIKEQVEKIEQKVEQSTKQKPLAVSELVQQTKQRFSPKKTPEDTSKKDEIMGTLKEIYGKNIH